MSLKKRRKKKYIAGFFTPSLLVFFVFSPPPNISNRRSGPNRLLWRQSLFASSSGFFFPGDFSFNDEINCSPVTGHQLRLRGTYFFFFPTKIQQLKQRDAQTLKPHAHAPRDLPYPGKKKNKHRKYKKISPTPTG